jgi:hypothetical protein
MVTLRSREDPRLTRERFVARYDPDPHFKRFGEAAFEERFAGDARNHVDPKIVEGDLDELRAASQSVERYVDRHIAHSDRQRRKTRATR